MKLHVKYETQPQFPCLGNEEFFLLSVGILSHCVGGATVSKVRIQYRAENQRNVIVKP